MDELTLKREGPEYHLGFEYSYLIMNQYQVDCYSIDLPALDVGESVAVRLTIVDAAEFIADELEKYCRDKAAYYQTDEAWEICARYPFPKRACDDIAKRFRRWADWIRRHRNDQASDES